MEHAKRLVKGERGTAVSGERQCGETRGAGLLEAACIYAETTVSAMRPKTRFGPTYRIRA